MARSKVKPLDPVRDKDGVIDVDAGKAFYKAAIAQAKALSNTIAAIADDETETGTDVGNRASAALQGVTDALADGSRSLENEAQHEANQRAVLAERERLRENV